MSAPIFKKSKVEQTIDLREVFGLDFSGLDSLKEAIGGAIIEHIRERTKSGDGMRFNGERGTPTTLKAPYSKQYSKSLDFKAFGKSRAKVNMTLTGDMLALMDIKKTSGNKITIGWDDASENAKAFNHSVGDTVPSRPFFGVSKSELNDIKKEFKSEIANALKARGTEDQDAFEERLAGLLSMLSGDDDES